MKAGRVDGGYPAAHWLYRVAWDNGFPGPGVASEQLNDAAWLSMHCLRPEELPASDLAPAVMSRLRGRRPKLPPGVF